MVGHEMSKKLELDAEFYGLGTFNHSSNQQTLDAGARYKLRPPFILLLMAGRSVAPELIVGFVKMRGARRDCPYAPSTSRSMRWLKSRR